MGRDFENKKGWESVWEVRDFHENIEMEEITCSEWQAEDSLHSIHRAKERAGLNRKKALKLIEHAKVRGITSEECKWSLDKNFLESRTSEEAIAVAYNGYCFILDRATRHCITMFHLPKCFGQKKTFYKNDLKRSNRWEEMCCI